MNPAWKLLDLHSNICKRRWEQLKIKKVNQYDQEIPQLQTVDKPMAPWAGAIQQSRDTRPRRYQTRVDSQTQNKAQWLAACGHMSASSQSLPFVLSLRCLLQLYNLKARKTKKQSNQLSLPHQDDCKTRMDTKQPTTKHRTITESHNGSNKRQRINNNFFFHLHRSRW